jgi:hypothetical protein
VSTQTGEYRNVSSRITILSSRMSGFRFARQTEPTAGQGYKDDSTSCVRGDMHVVKLWDI